MLLLNIEFMAQGEDFGTMNANEGEQEASQFMALCPHQSILLTELSSRFSNIDEHLFE